ncbi:Ig-like domain-containing protein [Haloarcula laminariae]|uniref:Ig-like domain-containing protein n=1 Tax=Haloarcula laminariae TaxID=2961577 RepID=UPI0021C6B358|nr:Ig-like domain-containing protein [Halomicroarcula laminariae]
MKRTRDPTKFEAVALSVVVVVSVVALSGAAVGAVTDDSLTVTDAPVGPDGTITVEGTVSDATNDVTFLIQDSENDDAVTTTKTVDSTEFTVTIDLSTLGIDGGLSDGTATLMADEGSTFESAEDTTTFEVDGQAPTVDIESPTDGENVSSESENPYLINGTASDDHSLDRVELYVQNESDGQYYNATSGNWESDRAWVTASSTSEWSKWSYDTSDIAEDGSYDVGVRVFDDAGNSRSYTDGPKAPTDTDTLQVDYTLDTTAPSVQGVTVTEQNSDDTVAVGDTVNVTADVTDATAGVDTVTVDASPLGGDSSMTLTQDAGDTYTGTFDVGSPNVGDGTVSLTVTGADAFGQTTDASDTVTLDTAIESVETLDVHQEFVAIVEDGNDSVAVTATGVRDQEGYLIASGSGSGTVSATLDIAGTPYTVPVNDGEIDTTIDPNAIADSTATGTTTVEVAQANDTSATDSVQLVHEAYSLDGGYQVTATPMDAETVEYQYVNSSLTYDAGTDSWVLPDEREAGSAYYVSGINDSARIGYTFESEGELHSHYLQEGYNLVGATPDLNDGDSVTTGADLGDAVSIDGNNNVEVYLRNASATLSDPGGTTNASAFDQGDGTSTVGPYEGYYVYVEDGDVVRVVEKADYEAGQGS